MDIIIDVYSKFIDNKNKIFVFNNKEEEFDFALERMIMRYM